MPSLYVTKRDGDRRTVIGRTGLSIMEVLRDDGLDEVVSLCGGSCSCATCHVYVEEGWLSVLPPMTGDENELLESSSHRKLNSRLSCQIPFSDCLDGIRIEIAPED